MQDGVVGKSLFETVLVEDGDVGIEVEVPQAQSVDLEAEPLALLHRNLEVIHVLGEYHAFDRAVQRDRLCLGELRVRLLLLDGRIGTDEELAGMRQARARADPHQVAAQRGVGGDGDGQLDLAGGDGVDALDAEARIIEQQRLEIFEARAGHGQLEFGAPLPAVGLAGAELGISGAQSRRQEQQDGQQTGQHGRSRSRGSDA